MSEWKSPRAQKAEEREFIRAIFEEQMSLVDRGEQSREQAIHTVGYFACLDDSELQPQYRRDGTLVRSE